MIPIEKIPPEEITPEALFLSRRKFIRLAAMFGTAYALAACGVTTPTPANTPIPSADTPTPGSDVFTDDSHILRCHHPFQQLLRVFL